MRKLTTWAAAIVMMSITLTVSAKEFIIYECMEYKDKPDLTADKLSKVFLISEKRLVQPDPTGKRKHGVLNLARIRELARQSHHEGYRTVSTDIETWFSDQDGQSLTPEELAVDFEQMYKIFKEENPNVYISNYGLPTSNLSVARFYNPNWYSYAKVVKNWREFNKVRELATAEGDYLNPVFYIFDPDTEKWEKDVETTMEEIRRKFPNKRVIGYLWPQYYSAPKNPYFRRFIDGKTWRKMLEVSRKHMDGVIIWSDNRDEHNRIVSWNDPRVQEMMDATKAFIAAYEKDIRVEGLKPK